MNILHMVQAFIGGTMLVVTNGAGGGGSFVDTTLLNYKLMTMLAK